MLAQRRLRRHEHRSDEASRPCALLRPGRWPLRKPVQPGAAGKERAPVRVAAYAQASTEVLEALGTIGSQLEALTGARRCSPGYP